jgi:UDP-N-acetylglucosamine diphosphorylase/glucosamine-1-phosphate N-acetyltransferase
MNYILFDDEGRHALLPFTHTRPVSDIRCGILTMRERWEKLLGCSTGTLTSKFLREIYPLETAAENTWISGALVGTPALLEAIQAMPAESVLKQGEEVIAIRSVKGIVELRSQQAGDQNLQEISYDAPYLKLRQKWDIFSLNEQAIRIDFELLTAGRTSAPIPEGITVAGHENIFLEEGARVQPGTVINATVGPVYVGKGAEIMEGCLMRGPLALCADAVLKMGAKLYGGTTIGPGCKVGGEVSNTVFFANSNKGHDGFLGNAVIGEWCNLGADTNSSNLKNNYDTVKIWDEYSARSISTGLTFCGLLMGDHSKCGINTMFNTGTVVGVSCNIYGGNFPEKFIPSFSWGGSEGSVTYNFTRAMDTARRMMARRHKELSPAEEKAFKAVFDLTQEQRDFMFGKSATPGN